MNRTAAELAIAMDSQIGYIIRLPVFVIGVLLNGLVILVMLRKRSTLLHNRIDHVYFFLISVAFVWSTCNVLIFLPISDSSHPARGQVIAALQSIPICLMVGPSSNEIYPDFTIQKICWISAVSLGFCVGFSIIIPLYTTTYYFVKEKLASSFTNHHVDTLRLHLQHHALKNSILMTAGILVCYVPQSICTYFELFGSLSGDTVAGLVIITLAFEFVVLDVLVTPVLVLYFSEPVRNAVWYWRRKEEEEEGKMEHPYVADEENPTRSVNVEMHYY
ncbi:hypothetical protein HDU98_009340 [Podochytrium sp. JEL0797]|nr:hypothetical protein HDU98_009340 [Podochytrium sp. JEL0797]